MKFFSSELGQTYGIYTFGYCNYGLLEIGDKISEMYERGYLPYSGSPASRGLFYMARSGRIHLPEFELDSECRRIAKKFDGLYTRTTIPLKGFANDQSAINFWLEYFKRAHGPRVMPRARFEHVINFGIITDVVCYRDTNGKAAAYTLEVSDEMMTGYWYSAYAEELDKTSFGMWLLIDIARAAKARGATYYYPGTVYGGSTDYKTNLPGLEYWNGDTWIKDSNNRALKARTNTDAKRTLPLVDEWKETHGTF